jgi:methyl-accepting chemotaxis protein
LKSPELDTLRRRGMVMIACAGWAATSTFAVLAAFMPGTAPWIALFCSALINIVPTWCALRGRFDSHARAAAAIMVALQPALLLLVTRGNAWQLDMHMYFFVGLATLTVLCDRQPFVIATIVIALHHLLLALIAPAFVFSGGGGVERVLIHALAVILQSAVLAFVADHHRALILTQAQSREESRELAEQAATAQARAEKALTDAADLGRQAEHERHMRAAAEIASADRRREEMMRFASEFEQSVAGVAAEVGAAAAQLERGASTLDQIARASGRQASEAAGAVIQLSGAARSVAGGVGTLSKSIASIAINAAQQDELSSHAPTAPRAAIMTCGRSRKRRPVSAVSRDRLRLSPRGPTCSRSTPRSRRPAQAMPAAASRSLHKR